MCVLYRQGQWQLLGGDGPLRDWLLLHVGVCVCCTDRDSGSCWVEMAPYVTGSYCMWVCVCCADRDSGSCWAEMAPYVTGSYCIWVCVCVLCRQGQWQLLGRDGPLRDRLLLHVGVCVCCTDRDSGSCWAEMAPYVTGSYCMWVCACVVQTGTVAAAGPRWPPT